MTHATILGLVVAASSLAAACGAPAARTRTLESATPAVAREAPAPHLEGTVSVERAPDAQGPLRGRLAVAWLTPDEARDMRTSRGETRVLIEMVARVRSLGDVDLATGPARFELPVAPGTYVPVVFFDTGGDFVRDLVAGDGMTLGVAQSPVTVTAQSPTARANVVLRIPPSRPRQRRQCEGPRAELVEVQAPDTDGAMGNGTVRRLCAYLPASYATSPARRYPVIYLFPGLYGTDTSRFGREHIGLPSDGLAAPLAREAILVGVDTSTRWGSSYLVDSPVTGAWEQYVARLAVAAVDQRFRTIADAGARGLLGHSTGGFNVVSLALRHPEVFSVVASSAPDALDMDAWLLDGGGRASALWLGWMRTEEAMGGGGQLTSYAVDWSHDAAAPRGFRWPVDLATGAVVPEVLERWHAHSPSRMLRDPRILAAARERLAGRMYLTVGRDDEAGLFAPTERFSQQLRAAGVEHEFVPLAGGHFDEFSARMRSMLEFVLRRVPAPR